MLVAGERWLFLLATARHGRAAPLTSQEPINKAFQLVTSTLNPLKATLLWAH